MVDLNVTIVITAVEITDESGSDYSQFIPLLNKTKIDFAIKEVSADKAYLGKSNLEAVAAIGAIPYIPYKSNTIPKRNVGHIWNKMYWHFKNNPQEWGEHYHKRSNVESTFNMVKQAFSGSLRTKNNTANVNEILCKAVCHNLCVLIMEYHENKLNIDLSTQVSKIVIPIK